MAVFAACPASPNCVSSDARDPRHAILPFVPQSSEPESWAALRSAILTLPRTRILVDEKDYLRVACRSAVLGFTDDLEIQLRPDEGEIAVRSARAAAPTISE